MKYAPLLLLLLVCQQDATRDRAEAESHWLARCDSDLVCGAEGACVCGVCTLACDSDLACGGVAAGAVCTARDWSRIACGESAGPVCALGCEADADCTEGDTSSCVEGHCVATEPPQEDVFLPPRDASVPDAQRDLSLPDETVLDAAFEEDASVPPDQGPIEEDAFLEGLDEGPVEVDANQPPDAQVEEDSEAPPPDAQISPDQSPPPRLNAGGPYEGVEGVALRLEARGPGLRDFGWDLDDDGTVDEPGASVDVTFDEDGAYTVRVQALSDEEVLLEEAVQILIADQAPVASPPQVLRGLTGAAIDADAGWCAYPGPDEPSPTQVDWGDGAAPLAPHAYPVAGRYAGELICADSDGSATRGFAVDIYPSDRCLDWLDLRPGADASEVALLADADNDDLVELMTEIRAELPEAEDAGLAVPRQTIDEALPVMALSVQSPCSGERCILDRETISLLVLLRDTMAQLEASRAAHPEATEWIRCAERALSFRAQLFHLRTAFVCGRDAEDRVGGVFTEAVARALPTRESWALSAAARDAATCTLVAAYNGCYVPVFNDAHTHPEFPLPEYCAE